MNIGKAFSLVSIFLFSLASSGCVVGKVKTYNIEFRVDNESYTYEVKEGELPVFKENNGIPRKASTPTKAYTFSHWNPSIEPATEDAVYRAVFTESARLYNVTWQNLDGSVLAKEQYEYNQTPTYKLPTPTIENNAQYTFGDFIGWEPAISEVKKDITYVASYEKQVNSYNVYWKNGDVLLKADHLPYGSTPTYTGPEPTKVGQEYDYIFTGWSPEIAMVTKDVTYQAQFAEDHTSVYINSFDDLSKIDGTQNYKLHQDIDCQFKELPSITKFTGTLNGNGYKITNLAIKDKPWISTLKGKLENMDASYIATVNAKGGKKFGLIGTNEGQVLNSNLSGVVNFYNTGYGTSEIGIVAATNHGSIENTKVTASEIKVTDPYVRSHNGRSLTNIVYPGSEGNPDDSLNYGFIVGKNEAKGSIKDSSVYGSKMNVKGKVFNSSCEDYSGQRVTETTRVTARLGHIAGSNYGTIENVVSQCDVSVDLQCTVETKHETIVLDVPVRMGAIGENDGFITGVFANGYHETRLSYSGVHYTAAFGSHVAGSGWTFKHSQAVGGVVGENSKNGTITKSLSASMMDCKNASLTADYVFARYGSVYGRNLGIVSDSGGKCKMIFEAKQGHCDLVGFGDDANGITNKTFAFGDIDVRKCDASFVCGLGNVTETGTITKQATYLESIEGGNYQSKSDVDVDSVETLLSKSFLENKLGIDTSGWTFENNQLQMP